MLMHDGLDYLDRKKQLNTVIREGMSETLRLKLAIYMIKQANTHWGLGLYLTNAPIDHTHTINFIVSEIGKGRFVCICVNGFYDHYTAICGYNTPLSACII